MSDQRHTPALPRMLLGAFLAVAALQFTVLFVPGERLWGIDMLRFLSPASVVSYAVIVLGAAFLLVHVRRMERLPDERGFLAFPLILTVLLLVCPIETFFYGDGGLLIPQIHRYSVTGEFDPALLLNVKSSPLAGGLIIFFMKAVPAILPWKPATALYPFVWVSVTSLLLAVGYLMVAYRGMKRIVALIVLLGTAGALLFRGYPEFYAPVFAAVAVYLAAGERAARRDAPLWHPVVAWLIAVAAHYMALILLPSLVYLIMERRGVNPVKSWTLRSAFVAAGVLIGTGLVGYFALGFHDSPSRIVMPIAAQYGEAGTQTYTLLSAAHVADFLNLLLLLAPLALPVLFFQWSGFMKHRHHDASTLFHVFTVTFFLVFAFFVNASLGLARDWDLLAPLGLVLLFAGVAAMEHAHVKYGSLALVFASLILTIPWHDLHRDAAATAERFEEIMRRDDGFMYGDYALSGYDALRKYYGREGNRRKEAALTQRMIERVGYPQHYRELAALVRSATETEADSTLRIYAWMLRRLEQQASALHARGKTQGYAIDMRQIDSLAQAVVMLSEGLEESDAVHEKLHAVSLLTRDGRPFPAVQAAALYAQGRYDSAAVLFRTGLAEGFASPELYLLFGNALALSRQYSASLARFEEGVRRYPDDGMLRFTLGKYYIRAGIQLERAAELLQWCITRDNPPDRRDEARELLRSILR
ncbi:MAG: hypothetical protein JXA28_01875 [Bacteroidetes bacterium]|nr:hypothetical protein [Bacteroidota bacterium]